MSFLETGHRFVDAMKTKLFSSRIDLFIYREIVNQIIIDIYNIPILENIFSRAFEINQARCQEFY